MYPCGICRCSTRSGTIAIAIITCAIFIFQLGIFALPELRNHFSEMLGPGIHALGLHIVLMILISILLGFGAYHRKAWLCYPWIVLQIITLCSYFILAIRLLFHIIRWKDYVEKEIVGFVYLLIVNAEIVYCLWVVFAFLSEIRNGIEYSEVDGDNENNRVSRSKGRKRDEDKYLWKQSNF